MGNPHAVLRVEDVDSAPVERLGPLLERAVEERGGAVWLVKVDTDVTGDGQIDIVASGPEQKQILLFTMPAAATEGDGVLTGTGMVRIAGTLLSNLVIDVVSTDTSEVTVPPTITIVAGLLHDVVEDVEDRLGLTEHAVLGGGAALPGTQLVLGEQAGALTEHGQIPLDAFQALA